MSIVAQAPPATKDVAVAPPARLTLATKIAYGVGDLGAAMSSVVIGFFLTAFLLDVVGLRPGVVGVIFLLSQIRQFAGGHPAPATGRIRRQ